jgi:hypothetical protein
MKWTIVPPLAAQFKKLERLGVPTRVFYPAEKFFLFNKGYF